MSVLRKGEDEVCQSKKTNWISKYRLYDGRAFQKRPPPVQVGTDGLDKSRVKGPGKEEGPRKGKKDLNTSASMSRVGVNCSPIRLDNRAGAGKESMRAGKTARQGSNDFFMLGEPGKKKPAWERTDKRRRKPVTVGNRRGKQGAEEEEGRGREIARQGKK